MLTVTGLSCMAGYRPLFTRLEIDLPGGQWLMLTGPNGTGKTSLLRALAGLVRPANGEIHWHAQPVRTSSINWRAIVHYLGHSTALKDTLSASENLRYWLSLDHGRDPGRQTVDSLLAQVGLTQRRDLPVARLSAGQRKRVQLARLHASKRLLWLLDEPANALDADGTSLLGSMLDEHLADGGCALVATHQELPVLQSPRFIDMTTYAGKRAGLPTSDD